MNKKQHLIKSLLVAIDALKNDTILYNWVNQESCNCGVVSQAVLGIDRHELKKRFGDIWSGLFSLKPKDKEEIDPTWKNAVKYFCPITGKSDKQILNDLQEAGLDKNDIVHLEYMDNPAILKKSGVKTYKVEIVMDKVLKESTVKTLRVPVKNPIMRLLGYTELVDVRDDVYEEEENEIKHPIDYWVDPSNLILYLQGWVSILKEGSSNDEEIEDMDNLTLEGELLNAVADEDFEKAAIIRDNISKI